MISVGVDLFRAITWTLSVLETEAELRPRAMACTSNSGWSECDWSCVCVFVFFFFLPLEQKGNLAGIDVSYFSVRPYSVVRTW